jgi:hypothetical protein
VAFLELPEPPEMPPRRRRSPTARPSITPTARCVTARGRIAAAAARRSALLERLRARLWDAIVLEGASPARAWWVSTHALSADDSRAFRPTSSTRRKAPSRFATANTARTIRKCWRRPACGPSKGVRPTAAGGRGPIRPITAGSRRTFDWPVGHLQGHGDRAVIRQAAVEHLVVAHGEARAHQHVVQRQQRPPGRVGGLHLPNGPQRRFRTAAN